jgi:hypothetical protein
MMLAGHTGKRAARSGDIGSSVSVAEPRKGDESRASHDDVEEGEEGAAENGDKQEEAGAPSGRGGESPESAPAPPATTPRSRSKSPEAARSASSAQSKRPRTDGLPPNGKLIVTPHVQTPQPKRGGRRSKKQEPEQSRGRKTKDDGDGEEITPKKSSYLKSSSVKLLTVLPARDMERIRRRAQFMMILRDGFQIDRSAPKRLLNLQLIEEAARGVLHPEDLETFSSALGASYHDKQDA